MKIAITAITAILLITSTASFAYAEVPGWVKNNAGWWADGTISESEFLTGIEFLIKDGVINIPPTQTSSPSESDMTEQSVPGWVKNNAGWWADGTISDQDFVNGIQHLVSVGLISVSVENSESQDQMQSAQTTEPVASSSNDPKLAELEASLEKCSEITKAYKRLDCEKSIEKEIMLYQYKMSATAFDLGSVTYYWFGVGSQGNEFEISSSGQPLLSIRMLAENTSSDNVSLDCTSPQICSYDVWDGTKAFKYSGMDFTSGQIVLNPGDSREFNILFGPNVGYGGTEFEYDPSKSYQFRINEDFGKINIDLNLE